MPDVRVAGGTVAGVTVGGVTVGDLGEDELVRAVLAGYAPAPGWLRVGPGDDAAVLELPALRRGGRLVVTTDTLVEGLDFRREWSDGVDVGVKLAAQNFADVAAMGARPTALLGSLAAPADLPVEFVAGLVEGLRAECARAGAAVVGGDVSGADQVVLTATALGVLKRGRRPVLRSGARPGDVVALAGRTGDSAAGLAVLASGRTPGAADGDPVHRAVRAALAAHRRPRPDYSAGRAAGRARATAMIDTSDGLLRDADRVARASGVLLDLDPGMLTVRRRLRRVADWLGTPARAAEWVLTGGEDHALLACFGRGARRPAAFRAVGRVRAVPRGGEPGVVVGGRRWDGETGWHHW